MTKPDSIILVTPFRRRARRLERDLQAWLDNGRTGLPPGFYPVPVWASGVRVERAGRLSWAVCATVDRGH